MSDGTGAVATKLREVDIITSNGDVHVTLEPNKTLIVDERGNALTTKKGLMTTLDAKLGKRIEISQGTMWFVGIVFVVMQLLLSYGSSLWSKSAEDSAVKTKVEAMQLVVSQQADISAKSDAKLQLEIEKLTDKLDALKDLLTQQATKDAYKKGQIDGATLQQGVK